MDAMLHLPASPHYALMGCLIHVDAEEACVS
jgi:hypothetical protein